VLVIHQPRGLGKLLPPTLLGGEVFGGGEAEAAVFLKAQQALWGKVVRERRITRE
jgi:hypothetical protein